MTPWIISHLWLIPAAPLLASLLILCFGTEKRIFTVILAITGQVVAMEISGHAFFQTLCDPGAHDFHNFTWFVFGETPLRLGWLLDPLNASMLMMITLVSLCIFIFSVGYMKDDPNFNRFFTCLSLFSAAMLGLVIANSLLLLFICWELVGLASYFLIGFWIHKPSAAAAAKKAFITTRIGDIGFFLGLLWLYGKSGTLLSYANGEGCLEHTALLSLGGSVTFIALLIFCGAAGKSGQFPLHVWLPDAMEGPTPVSALIHAATMVAAGVFLVARMFPLFSFGAIHGVTPALETVVWIGTITSVMASLIAIAQSDIKRILAYSTVSQLGLMMVSLGVGGMAAGIMHLLAHGFFKALLFLGAGSVIHGCHHEQDIRKMGGLQRLMPVTFATYAVGMMALSGFPLLFSGAWTKEEILHATWLWPVSVVPHVLMLAGVFLTALYMTRQMAYVFFGKARDKNSLHAHESPRVMTIPLIVLAVCTVLFSIVLTPAWPWLESYLTGEHIPGHFAAIFQPMVFFSVALVGAGVWVGMRVYSNAGSIDPLQQAQPELFHFLENKMWVDEFYEHTLLKWSATAARLADWMDRRIWDGFVRATASAGRLLAYVTSNFDQGGINLGVDQGCDTTQDLARTMSAWHSGNIQTYLRAIGLGTLALLILYILLG
ncbi:MAG: NADH-quinone oxidoreductase subunit L [Chthoniobacteraceae bacterium]